MTLEQIVSMARKLNPISVALNTKETWNATTNTTNIVYEIWIVVAGMETGTSRTIVLRDTNMEILRNKLELEVRQNG